MNLLEVEGDRLPKPVGVRERLRLDAIDRLLGLLDEGVQIGTRSDVQPPKSVEELAQILVG